jgi:hypothetical protein
MKLKGALGSTEEKNWSVSWLFYDILCMLKLVWAHLLEDCHLPPEATGGIWMGLKEPGVEAGKVAFQ